MFELQSLLDQRAMQAINQDKPGPQGNTMHQPSLDVFMRLAGDLDTEGRYLFLNALANQLRYPNNHTHYFSCILLYLFNETTQVDKACPMVTAEPFLCYMLLAAVSALGTAASSDSHEAVCA